MLARFQRQTFRDKEPYSFLPGPATDEEDPFKPLPAPAAAATSDNKRRSTSDKRSILPIGDSSDEDRKGKQLKGSSKKTPAAKASKQPATNGKNKTATSVADDVQSQGSKRKVQTQTNSIVLTRFDLSRSAADFFFSICLCLCLSDAVWTRSIAFTRQEAREGAGAAARRRKETV